MGQNIWKDGIMGLMVGDALGVPVEFSSREDREHDPVIGMRAYGTCIISRSAPGQTIAV